MAKNKSVREKLGKPVGLRVTATEGKGFRRAAHISGLAFSQWARLHLRLAARAELEAARQPVPFMT